MLADGGKFENEENVQEKRKKEGVKIEVFGGH
jgi:hypothetical protein